STDCEAVEQSPSLTALSFDPHDAGERGASPKPQFVPRRYNEIEAFGWLLTRSMRAGGASGAFCVSARAIPPPSACSSTPIRCRMACALMPLQGLLVVAAALPASWEVCLVDENIRPATRDDCEFCRSQPFIDAALDSERIDLTVCIRFLMR